MTAFFYYGNKYNKMSTQTGRKIDLYTNRQIFTISNSGPSKGSESEVFSPLLKFDFLSSYDCIFNAYDNISHFTQK